MPSGLYSFWAHASSRSSWYGLTAATGPSVMPNLEPRVSIQSALCSHIAHAKSLRIHDLVLKHGYDRETGYRVLINLLLRRFLDFLTSVRHFLGGDMRLLCWRRRRDFKDERCDAGKNEAVNDSHEFIKQLHPRDQSDARTRARSQSLRERKSASCVHFARGVLWSAMRLRIAF